MIGTVRHVRADFAFRVPRDPRGGCSIRRWAAAGFWTSAATSVSFARLIAGLVEGEPFAEPSVRRQRRHRPARRRRACDRAADVLVGVDGHLHQRRVSRRGDERLVFGEEGKIVLPDPWIPGGKRQAWSPASRSFATGRRPSRSRSGPTRRPTPSRLSWWPTPFPRWRRVAGDDLGRHAGQYARPRRLAGCT